GGADRQPAPPAEEAGPAPARGRRLQLAAGFIGVPEPVWPAEERVLGGRLGLWLDLSGETGAAGERAAVRPPQLPRAPVPRARTAVVRPPASCRRPRLGVAMLREVATGRD